MIAYVLENIRKYIEANLKRTEMNVDGWNTVKLGAIEKDGQEAPGVYITLIRIEEEAAAKRPMAFHRSETDAYYANPDVNLNLYILISSQLQDYCISLDQLSKVIGILNGIQDLRSLTPPSGEEDGKTTETPENKVDNVRRFMQTLSMEMQSLSAEQHNSLWQTLGGKMLPSVCYKVRMITISDETNRLAAALIGKGGIRLDGEVKIASPGTETAFRTKGSKES